MRIEGDALRGAERVHPHPERARRGDLRVLLPERTRRAVARVGEWSVARLGQPDVQLLERLHREVDLASDLDHRRGFLRLEASRDRLQGTDVRRDVLAGPAVAARRRHREDPVLVGQGAGDAVDLELADERGGRAGQSTVDARAPGPELLFGERVVQREHRGSMRDRAEQLGRRGADALGGRVRCDQLREVVLDRAELTDQLVVLSVRDLGVVQDVVAVQVVVDELAKLFDPELRLGELALVLVFGFLHPAISRFPATPIRSPTTNTPPRTPGTLLR